MKHFFLQLLNKIQQLGKFYFVLDIRIKIINNLEILTSRGASRHRFIRPSRLHVFRRVHPRTPLRRLLRAHQRPVGHRPRGRGPRGVRRRGQRGRRGPAHAGRGRRVGRLHGRQVLVPRAHHEQRHPVLEPVPQLVPRVVLDRRPADHELLARRLHASDHAQGVFQFLTKKEEKKNTNNMQRIY